MLDSAIAVIPVSLMAHGALVSLGKLSDDAEVTPEPLLFGRLARSLHLGPRFEAEELVGGHLESPAKLQQHGDCQESAHSACGFRRPLLAVQLAMRSKAESARELAAELRRLLESERSDEPLDRWYAKSLTLQRNIRADPDLSDLVPNFVWDWLAGADVRKKEPEVAGVEDADIRAVIEQLERGIWPE